MPVLGPHATSGARRQGRWQDASGLRRSESRLEQGMRLLRWLVIPAALLSVPLYVLVRWVGLSNEKLDKLPEVIDRLKHPIVWEVPDGGVRYERFFHAQAEPGCRFVVVQVRMEARVKVGFPVVPRCFRLVDDHNVRHYPLARSPLFIDRGDSIALERGTVLEGELLFEIPEERQACNLLFDRYQETRRH